MFTGIPSGGWIGEGTVLKRELRLYDIVAVRCSTVGSPALAHGGFRRAEDSSSYHDSKFIRLN